MKGECEMGFDFRGSKERVSLSFTAENELSAENECRCERISCVCLCVCVCAECVTWHWLFPSFLKPVYVQCL